LPERRALCGIVTVIVAGALAACGSAEKRETATLSVLVAASLQNAMVEIQPVFEKSEPGIKLTYNFGGSGTLQQQIEHGAPADVFFSAAPKPMDVLASKDLIVPETRRDVVRNGLVLIVPAAAAGPNSFADMARDTVKLIAIGEPESVPAGTYARQTLQALHVWDAVRSKLVLAKDVRQVLTYVETGNADAGIVYATDARESAKVRIAATAPADTHDPILYPVAVVKGSRNLAAARTFVTFLSGSVAGGIFARHGFTTVSP
jgi:molybdate transport system substrate-binding protein